MENIEKKVYLEFKTNTSNGKVYHNYFVNTEIVIRDKIRKNRVDMLVGQNDRGTYEILDTIFETGEKQELRRILVKTYDQAIKNTRTSYRYEVRDINVPSLVAILRPASKSAESLLVTYFDKIIQFNNAAEEVEEEVVNTDVVQQEEKKD